MQCSAVQCSVPPRLGVAVFPLEHYQAAIEQLKAGTIAKAVFDLSK